MGGAAPGLTLGLIRGPGCSTELILDILDRAPPAFGGLAPDPLNPTPQQQAEILMQALPHMLLYDDAIVVENGGHAMGDEMKACDFAKDMLLLEQSGINPVVVHGGGAANRLENSDADRRRAKMMRRAVYSATLMPRR